MEDLGPFVTPHSHSHDFVAKSNGQPYRIWVATPARRQPGVVRPVLYTLDANASFGMVVETARFLAFENAIPQVIVVGIGYPDADFRTGMLLRNYDLSPSHDDEYVQMAAEQGQPLPEMGLGGAPGFLRFITEEVTPFVEETYGADPNDRALFGFSLGGLFATFALLQAEPALQRFILGSPSLWWKRREMFELEEKRAEGSRELPARVFISAGDEEEMPGRGRLNAFRMVSNTVEFAGRLDGRGYEGLEVELKVFEGAGHQQPPMLVRGLKSIYRGFQPPRPD